MAGWNAFESSVTMPLQAPGGKLSTVELLKLLGALQWEGISRVLGVPTRDIVNESRERLYASFINVELRFGESYSPDRFGEGSRLSIRNRVAFFAQRFVEGLFVFDDDDVPPGDIEAVATLEALRTQPRPYAYFTNAFIAREGGNSMLRVYKPMGSDALAGALADTPRGIRDHVQVQSTGEIPDFDDAQPALALPATREDPIRYQIVPESDLNGAGLVYFARYPAMLAYAVRVFGEERLARPLSMPLVEALSTDRLLVYYFANATPTDAVDVTVSAGLIPPGSFPAAPASRPFRTPFKLLFRLDAYRASDRILMASALVRLALNVPGSAKGILTEADRFLRWAPKATR